MPLGLLTVGLGVAHPASNDKNSNLISCLPIWDTKQMK
jgi:hypothetical protein